MTRSVVIVDDHGLFREGIQMLVSRDPRLIVIGQGASSADALSLAAEHAPDVLLLDVEIPGHPAAITVRTLRRSHPHMAIVILTMHADRVLAAQLMAAGATCYLVKTVASVDLLHMLRTATASTARDVLAPSPGASREILTGRELEVLRLVSLAYSNKEIGRQLCLADGTVKRHVGNILAKLDATSRIDAVRRGGRLRLLG